MASSSINPLISSLIEVGTTLSRLHQGAKTPPKTENSTTTRQETLKSIRENVEKEVKQVLEKLDTFQLPASFPENFIPKVFEKLQLTLQKFNQLDTDNAQTYENLTKTLNDFKSKRQSAAAGSSSVSGVLQHSESFISDYSTQQEASTFDNPQEVQLEGLNGIERKCLVCFCLFSAGKLIRKREPIHMWIGMDLVPDSVEGAKMLAKLVAEGFIEPTVGHKKLYNRYKMNSNVQSMVVTQMAMMKIEQGRGSFSIMYQQQRQQNQQQQQPPPQQPESKNPTAAMARQHTLFTRDHSLIKQPNQDDTNVVGTFVLNISENTLDAKTFERLSIKKNTVKLLHLGSWDQNPKRYIMVEDTEVLKAFTKMGQVTFLSLQGISGIVELPDSVYRLENLKVLDLRACPNLESLSEGIESLKNLTHLDLSECYLLAHIPKKIALLTKLKVLKGFVINPEDPQVENENGDENEKGKNESSFTDLLNLKQLIKLTIRTRRMSFPTNEDFEVLNVMKSLASLKIAWVWSSDETPSESASGTIPPSLKKLELQAAPENTMSRLLRLICEDTQNSLEKLYIRGGRLWDLGMEMHYFRHVHTVRLRYLPELRIDWDEFSKLFPQLTRLEVLGCPNLIFFPCDENGVWEKTEYSQ